MQRLQQQFVSVVRLTLFREDAPHILSGKLFHEREVMERKDLCKYLDLKVGRLSLQ